MFSSLLLYSKLLSDSRKPLPWLLKLPDELLWHILYFLSLNQIFSRPGVAFSCKKMMRVAFLISWMQVGERLFLRLGSDSKCIDFLNRFKYLSSLEIFDWKKLNGKVLAGNLIRFPQIRILRIMDCSSNAIANWDVLCKAIVEQCDHLEQLSLRRTELGMDGINTFLNELAATTKPYPLQRLENVDFRETFSARITDTTIVNRLIHMGKTLPKMKTICGISLQLPNPTKLRWVAQGLGVLECGLLRHYMSSMSMVSCCEMDGNPRIGDQGMTTLFDTADSWRYLVKLSLIECNLSDAGIVALTQETVYPPNLTDLDLTGVNINAVGAHALGGLRRCKLRWVRIGDVAANGRSISAAAPGIALMITNFAALKGLDISNRRIGEQCVRILVEAIKGRASPIWLRAAICSMSIIAVNDLVKGMGLSALGYCPNIQIGDFYSSLPTPEIQPASKDERVCIYGILELNHTARLSGCTYNHCQYLAARPHYWGYNQAQLKRYPCGCL